MLKCTLIQLIWSFDCGRDHSMTKTTDNPGHFIWPSYPILLTVASFWSYKLVICCQSSLALSQFYWSARKKKCFDHRQQVGDDLTVICEVRGGSPRPSVTWWREGSIYDSSYELSDYDTVTNTLTYPGLVREDLGTKFVCQASNTNSTPPVSQEVHISLNCKLILEFGSIALCYHG